MMSGERAAGLRYRRLDVLLGALILAVTFSVFRYAPIQQAGDSRYTMLLAENILRHGDVWLDRYNLPDSDYRIHNIDGHRYYYFPPGTSVLSIPFVATMHLRGVSAVRPDGAYDRAGELALDAKLAALLMAGFAALSYFTARLLLPVAWSLAVTSVAAFGTQVFSTASRSMWSDTWGIVLISLAVLLLLRSAVHAQRPNLPLLATLECLAYVVRPTNSLVVLGTGLYVAVTNRKYLWQFVLTVAGWLGLFFIYSWVHFHKIVPDYFVVGRLQFAAPWSALLGTLVSPSRGLLVYVPVVVAIALVLVGYRSTVRFPALSALALFVTVGHLVALSGFAHWWGGHSYGARLTTSLVPWFVLLAILAVDAFRATSRGGVWRPAEVVLGVVTALLCISSIAINAIGAFSRQANDWNVFPESIDRAPDRLWSWQRPQFLAPFVEPQGPFLPLPGDGLHLGTPEADRYLGFGWAAGEGAFRWTEGRGRSTIRFSLPGGRPGVLEFDLRPYLDAGRIPEQRVIVTLNDRDLGEVTLRTADFVTYGVPVAADVSRQQNVLRLSHPDAASPAASESTQDRRQLGVAVRTIRWRDTEPSSVH
jgi:hypothetical protein